MSSNRTESALQSFWTIVNTVEPPELGPGPRLGVLDVHDLLKRLREWGDSHEVTPAIFRLLKAVALLYHDHHDEAHDLVQDGSDADTALIHAILHRREPDFWNAKYWFRRVPDHPIYRDLTAQAERLATDDVNRRTVSELTMTGSLDPFRFVDVIESVSHARTRGPEATFLRQVQQAEFGALVAYLLRSNESSH